jgi:hypothetical protein
MCLFLFVFLCLFERGLIEEKTRAKELETEIVFFVGLKFNFLVMETDQAFKWSNYINKYVL